MERTSIDLAPVGVAERYAERRMRQLIARADAAANARVVRASQYQYRIGDVVAINAAMMRFAARAAAANSERARLDAWAAAGGQTASMMTPASGVLAESAS